ncbi:DUF1127 domain-containing protein [Rhizobium mongolense]|uniref:Uncharacterized protein YjiS (DUF1127 family) n=1 Tax=Rhizobium mongolense TaxID=57676 RepID=A0A7W6RP94_9HYPH|nr:DUF1127 domain-containing protein [Rhizobium mongolense]MBB4276130.1 uncharacterized protein YjiS (DUF1127 family) [Rhizobium mongolense]
MTAEGSLDSRAEAPPAVVAKGTRHRLQTWQNAIVRYFEKRKTRRSLLELTAAQLNDIGLTPEAARAEASKSWFWQ